MMTDLKNITEFESKVKKEILAKLEVPDEIKDSMPRSMSPERWIAYLEYVRAYLVRKKIEELLHLEKTKKEIVPSNLFMKALQEVDDLINEIYKELNKYIPNLIKTYWKLIYGKDEYKE